MNITAFPHNVEWLGAGLDTGKSPQLWARAFSAEFATELMEIALSADTLCPNSNLHQWGKLHGRSREDVKVAYVFIHSSLP